MVRLGVERLLAEERDLIEGERVGLITNQSGVDATLTSTIDRLHAADGVDLVRLFGPEHGIRGREQAGVAVEDSVDEATGLPVESLYGDDRELDPASVADLDAVVYDVQDIGCRYYTLAYTLANALEGVAAAGKRLIVLDRPNPVAPLDPAGNRIEAEFASFVGDYGLPIVHGLTVGELATYVNEAYGVGADLDVVELSGWTRETWYDETGLPWVPPSPNMPTLDTATLYPGTCLFEGTTLSEGRGTTRPFELVGAPWIDAQEWAASLDDFDLPGVGFRPAYFVPTFSKHEGEDVEGVAVHVLDRDAVDPVRVGLAMLASAFLDYPESDWVETDDGHFLDRLAGGPYLRELVDGAGPGGDPSDVLDAVEERWAGDPEAFLAEREAYERYP